MSIEQAHIVDFIGIEKTTGRVILTITDHLDWSDVPNHLHMHHEKLNAYLLFCSSGQLFEQYPQAKGRLTVISLDVKYPLDERGLAYLDKVRPRIEGLGVEFQVSAANDDAVADETTMRL